MNRQRHMTAFYLETVLMVIIFMLVIAVLAQVFSQARLQSKEAQRMTNAVCLAQNAAEVVMASDSEETLCQLLDENGNATAEGIVVTAWYDADMNPLPPETEEMAAGMLRVNATWDPEESDSAGSYVNSDISVYAQGGDEPLYTMHTGVYLKQKRAAKQEVAQ